MLVYGGLRRVPLGVMLAAVSVTSVAATKTPELSITGGPSLLRDNVRQYLTIASEPCKAPLWRLKSLLLDAQTEIEQAAQAVGYYQLTYTTKLTQEKDCWQLHIALAPGEPAVIKQFNLIIEGDGQADGVFEPITLSPGLAVGDKFNHGHYETLKNRITTAAASHGYFQGRFVQSHVEVNQAENGADITLIYNTGPRYKLGDIRMHHGILHEKFLRRYLNIASGDDYDTDKLLELKSFYNATNYFNLATAAPDLQNLHDQQVDIDVQLEERKRYYFPLGFGIATDTGPRVRIGAEDRYVNDWGHSLKGDYSYSTVKSSSLLTYSIPLEQPSFESLRIYAGYDREDADTAYSRKHSYGTSYTYYQHSHWLHTYALTVENEYSALDGAPLTYSHLIIPSVTFSRTETDGNPYPLRGWNFTAKFSGSPNALGSDVSFVQMNMAAKYIQALPYGRLLLRAELGATQVSEIGSLPISQRFFAGGDTRVRGYDYKSLGPTDANGKVVGGNNLWVNTVEYDYRVKPNWAVATFYDLGNAADDFKWELKRSAGIGLRWISPVGPVRMDIAKGLDEPYGWHLHVSMGPDL